MGWTSHKEQAMKVITELEVYPTNAPTEMTWDEANEYCASLGGGWRLPTKEELNEMYLNKDEIGEFGENWLWSSSQSSIGNYAWNQNFSNSNQGSNYKSLSSSVRACRAFTHLSIDPLEGKNGIHE